MVFFPPERNLILPLLVEQILRQTVDETRLFMFFLKVSLVDFVLLDKAEGKSVLAVSGQSARAVQSWQSV